jgi:hypothetical protein
LQLPLWGLEELHDGDTDQIMYLLDRAVDPVRTASLGLGRYSLDLRGLDRLYQRAGLTRSRRVFGVRRNKELVGIAMCYMSSIPINFSLLCNRIEITVKANAPDRSGIIHDLVFASTWAARTWGRTLCPVLIAPADAWLAADTGLEDTGKQYCHMVLERETAAGWPSATEHFARLYAATAK